MRSKLLAGVAFPALLALSAATAFAGATPTPSTDTPAATQDQAAPAAPDAAAPTTPPAASPPAADSAAPAAGGSAAAPSASDSGASSTAEAPKSDTSGSGAFASEQGSDEWRSTRLVGLAVYNSAGENIGDVNDLILGSDGKIATAVIGVGGFLGLGEKLVGVPFSDLKFDKDDKGNVRVSLNSSKETLETAPDFKYAGDKKN